MGKETPPKEGSDKGKGKYEVTVDLVKALAWPLLVGIVLLRFSGPVGETLDQLPNIVSRSNTVEIGTIKLQLDKRLPEPQSDVKEVLAKLTSRDIQVLIRGGISYFDSIEIREREYAELFALKLAVEIPSEAVPLEQSKSDSKYGARLTPLGEKTKEYLIQVTSVFLLELEQSQSVPKEKP